MSLNSTPSSERIHIGFFGKRNAGKSSLINAITNQELAIVSDVKGTTTDPVHKAMELLPLGPVSVIDTAGYDDNGELGKLRIEKTKQVLNKVDIAILVVDASVGLEQEDKDFIFLFEEKNIKYIIVYNKCDLAKKITDKENKIYVSAKENINIEELKNLISFLYVETQEKQALVKDLVFPSDVVILVTPIDASAPKGRLILPQQQVIRELLEAGAITQIVQPDKLRNAIDNCKNKPKFVITDSQAFKKVDSVINGEFPLTSFSILFARYKGILEYAVKGVKQIDKLEDNDTILISEGCTHHRQCEDIGTVKLPNWIKNYTGKNLNFEFSSGNTFPTDLSKYKMVIHCGGCMLKDKEVINRYQQAFEQNIPVLNYGITIAYINGILKRSIEIFPDLYNLLK